MTHFLIALLVGALSAFAFEPVGLWPLMLLAIAGLCELVSRSTSLKQSLAIGWGFGLGQFAVGLNWIATAFTYQSNMPAWLGWVAVALLSLYLAVYPALAAGLGWRFGRDRPLTLVLALAGAWPIVEWLRGKMFTGFPWNPLGVTFADTPWLHTAPVIGTYGMSGLLVLAGGAAWLATRKRWLPAALIATSFLLAGFGLAPASPAAASARHIRVVQPNIGQQDKWRPEFAEEAARRLTALSLTPGGARPRLLLWPEAAVTYPLEDGRAVEQPYAEFERQRAAATVGKGEYLLTGGIAIFSQGGRAIDGAANSVFVLGQGGQQLGRYDKAHLTPYGEYLPMRPLLSSIGLSRLAPGDTDFTPGPGPRTFALPGWGKIGFQICYEIIFPGEVVDRRDRPDFIFNPSNDAWFGRWGPPQHLAQARLRAAEEGIPVIRSTPTGISAVIDASGAVRAALPWRTAGVIDQILPPAAAPTLFARFGNVIPLLLGFALLIGGIVLGRTRR
ncbi:MAG TPA: apolipoprotein N-acyltransferase [Sphingomicrobium sp.]|nr:apolipoprotein N-acyltransferase [Sphingomicrobium sp.]